MAARKTGKTKASTEEILPDKLWQFENEKNANSVIWKKLSLWKAMSS